MQDKIFRAATIATPDSTNRQVLEAAFNNWAEETKPASILHVHYYHDDAASVRGYQVVYEESWMPYLAAEAPQEEETARLLV